MFKTGILLVNLGTPDSPSPTDVRRYLIEFLTDGRVIDSPWLTRQLLVRGVIVPSRFRQSARSYQSIWTDKGSPLLVHGQNLTHSLQNTLGGNFSVELAMRYQNPSIAQAIHKLLNQHIQHLIVLPLFPQYASATTGSVHQKVMEILQKQTVIPKTTFISHFFSHPSYIEACKNAGVKYSWKNYDEVLFSFHGLPERQLINADPHGWCIKTADCCQTLCKNNLSCYSAQCHATAHAIAASLDIPKKHYSLCFQSRLGKEPWIQPYASEVIHRLAKEGKKKLLVFSPSFVCDCLETIFEIGVEYAKEFQDAGGESLDLVPALNAEPSWVDALRTIILEQDNSDAD